MPPELIFAIIFFFIVVGIPVMCGTLIKLAKIIKGEPTGKSKNGQTSSREEAEIVQDINQLVSRLEKRIDSLETIVLDKTSR